MVSSEAPRRYGGRIDNHYDSMLLRTFVDHLFQENSFSPDFRLNLLKTEGMADWKPHVRGGAKFQ